MAQLIDLGKLRFDFKGAYSNATTYELNDVVRYGANAYVYINATSAAGNLPTATTHWALLTSGVQNEGDYNSATAYQPNDIVTYGPKLYVALQATTGNVPTNTTYWDVLIDGVGHQGAWSSSTASYYPGDIVTRGGSQYICLLTHVPNASFETDLTANKWADFARGLRWRGTWAASTAYLKDDLVTDTVDVYVATNDFTSNSVDFASETSGNWDLFTAGTDNLPSQASKANYLLTTDGTSAVWENDIQPNTVTSGDGAAAFAGTLDNVVSTFAGAAGGSSDNFAQFVVRNTDDDGLASTDIIIYPEDGVQDAGWIDMGITGANFNSATYGITGPHDGYIFMVAPEGTTGSGNLVLATGDTGADNKLVFAAGGLESGTTQMEITPDTNVHIEIATESTSPTTGALTVVGGVGTQGNMNILGDVTVQGSLTVFGGAFESETLVSTNPIFTTGTGATENTSDRGFLTEYKAAMASTVTFDIGTVLANGTIGTITRKGFTTLTKSLSNNVATIQVQQASHSIAEGDTVVIANLGAPYDGTFTVTSVTSTTFSYEATGSNQSATADTDGTIQVNIPTGQTGFVYGDSIVISDCNITAFNGTRNFVKSISGNTITFDFTGTQSLATATAGTVSVSTKTRYTGLVRNATNNEYTLIDGQLPVSGPSSTLIAPSSDIDFASGNLTRPTLNLGNVAFASGATIGGAPTISGNATFSGTGMVFSGTFTGNGTFSGNPTFSGTPVFSGNPSFTGTPVFSGGVRVQEMIEDVVDVSHTSNAVTLDYSTGNIFWLTNTPSSALTANITNAPTVDGRAFTVTVLITQGSTGYLPTTLNINSTAHTIKWIGGVVPTGTSSTGKIDIVSFTILRRAGVFTAFGSATLNQ